MKPAASAKAIRATKPSDRFPSSVKEGGEQRGEIDRASNSYTFKAPRCLCYCNPFRSGQDSGYYYGRRYCWLRWKDRTR
jgi:hypothetical protein